MLSKRYSLPRRAISLLAVLSVYAVLLTQTHTTTVVAQTNSTPIKALDEVNKAVVQIATIGEYREPDDEEVFHFVTGAGFIVDPSGLIVTNNHVVAGSRTLLVYLDGAERPRYASVVALSECSDLALLKLSGGDYPYLAWGSGTVVAGARVYAYGYSSGALKRTEGSVRNVVPGRDGNIVGAFETIVHTAAISSGDSGGPLVGDKGQVLGINFSSNSRLRQGYTISAAEAQDTIQRLQRSQVSESLGIAGAVWSEGDRNGIWITAVQPDSPAARAGLQPGQVLLSMGGEPMAEDSSMTAYCNLLRTWDGADPLSYEVYSPDRRTVRTGEFVASFGALALPDVSFVRRQLTGLEFLLPAAWSDVEITYDDEDETWHMDAAPDLPLWSDAKGGGELMLTLFADSSRYLADAADVLADMDLDDFCEETQTLQHAHMSRATTFEGAYLHGTQCFDANINVYFLMLRSRPMSSIVSVFFTAMTEEDDLAFDVFRHSFRLAPSDLTGRGANPTVRILAATLNVRSGPGTNYGRVSGLTQGDQVDIIGRDSACTWLKVALPSGATGWISASASYVTFTATCDSIPITD